MTLKELVDQYGLGILVRKTTNKASEPVRVISQRDELVFVVEGTHTDEEYTERADMEGYEKLLSATEKLAGTVA